mmetsp:Transcript_20734/g.29911  ORF Transcript_20734/g.29911 Transcript_20734/m.29911 type:complete len:212 (-) Transcript_20734:182-817(-)
MACSICGKEGTLGWSPRIYIQFHLVPIMAANLAGNTRSALLNCNFTSWTRGRQALHPHLKKESVVFIETRLDRSGDVRLVVGWKVLQVGVLGSDLSVNILAFHHATGQGASQGIGQDDRAALHMGSIVACVDNDTGMGAGLDGVVVNGRPGILFLESFVEEGIRGDIVAIGIGTDCHGTVFTIGFQSVYFGCHEEMVVVIKLQVDSTLWIV